MDPERWSSALRTATDHLLKEMNPEGFWKGELSSSALSTAIALSAISITHGQDGKLAVTAGVRWLADTQNADGGWGDTTDSPSNLSTSLLVIAALKLTGGECQEAQRTAQLYISATTGSTPAEIVQAVNRIYGADRTFAVPILMNCALAGMVPWSSIPALPFELAIFPQAWYKLMRLHVVSYALPALIAIGLTIYRNVPPKSAFVRWTRSMATKGALKKLTQIQPDNGGFLEATPLTGFVAMSLGSVYGGDYPVVAKCIDFIMCSQRADGSWPIDTDLSVWLTTSAVSSLGCSDSLSSIDAALTGGWIANRQHRMPHPFTGAAPGGFPWTHHPGGVPDADDTSGAVLACLKLGQRDAAARGVVWLLGLQNSDGGWPAFCRGWGQLPFDKSSPDITSHAIRALQAFGRVEPNQDSQRAIARGFRYLRNTQLADGSWIPLWFGNQAAVHDANPVFGTARTLLAYAGLDGYAAETAKGVEYLLRVQNTNGGWGGASALSPSVEETANALAALARHSQGDGVPASLVAGAEYLVARVEDGTWTSPTPIGLYFSSLWYSERLYPVIWTVEALGSLSALDIFHINRIDDNVCSS